MNQAMNGVQVKNLLSTALSYERELFPSHLPRQLKELYLSNAILNIALSGAFFEAIYLYSIGFSLSHIMLFCAGIYAIYLILMPLGGKIVKYRGFEHGMIFGSVFLILYYIFLLSIPSHSGFIFLAIVSFGLHKTFFWPGYHADFAYFGRNGERGRELSNLVVLNSISMIIGPLLGGVVTALFGFNAFFFFMCVIVFLSNIPFLLQKEIFIPSHPLPYADVYRSLFKKENRRHVFGYLGFGEELINATIWPIFIFVALQNLASTGAAVAITTCVTALLLLYVGRETDLKDRKKVLKIGAIMTIFSWLIRIMASGAGQVLLVDFFARTSKNILALPVLSGLYEYAQKNSVVRTVIYFEMSAAIGKLGVSLLLALIFFILPNVWQAAFAIGALFSLLYLFLLTNPSHLKK